MFALRRAVTAVPRTTRSLSSFNHSLRALSPATASNVSLTQSLAKPNQWRAMSVFAGETQRAFIQRKSIYSWQGHCVMCFYLLLFLFYV